MQRGRRLAESCFLRDSGASKPISSILAGARREEVTTRVLSSSRWIHNDTRIVVQATKDRGTLMNAFGSSLYHKQAGTISTSALDGELRGGEMNFRKAKRAALSHRRRRSNPRNKRKACGEEDDVGNRPFPPDYLDVFVSCQKGLEGILSEELTGLRIDHKVERNGATLLRCTGDDLTSCHLHLGSASQVSIRCGGPFLARALGELKRKVERMPWKELLLGDEGVELRVKVTSSKSRLFHTGAIRERVVEAINRSLGCDGSDRDRRVDHDGNNDDEAPVVPLSVRLFRDMAQISLETSTTPIHQRGYRLETAKAPLREDLAFALLFEAGWKPRRKKNQSGNGSVFPFDELLDPFCGSGTIAIEAAALACDLPPGRLRPAPLAGTTLFDACRWKEAVSRELGSRNARLPRVPIFASDRDAGAVRIAAANAERAGVRDAVEIRCCAFSRHPRLESPAAAASGASGRLLVVSNLPFGKRLSPKRSKTARQRHLLPLYQSLASCLNRLRDVDFGLLTDDPSLFRRSGYGRNFEVGFRTSHGGRRVSALTTYDCNRENGE